MQAMSPAPDPLMTLSQQVQWMSTATLQQMEAGITMARVSRTRQEEVTRLQFRVLDETVKPALRAGLCITGVWTLFFATSGSRAVISLISVTIGNHHVFLGPDDLNGYGYFTVRLYGTEAGSRPLCL